MLSIQNFFLTLVIFTSSPVSFLLKSNQIWTLINQNLLDLNLVHFNSTSQILFKQAVVNSIIYPLHLNLRLTLYWCCNMVVYYVKIIFFYDQKLMFGNKTINYSWITFVSELYSSDLWHLPIVLLCLMFTLRVSLSIEI